ncbi:MAG: DUF4920 domain-containing protein [Cyclobacteriaceae bacterium]|nr:DUF4920 domain-containing protein [Cyclobacteriaceae bacterium]
MKGILFIASILLLSSCDNSNQSNKNAEFESIKITNHGEVITDEGAISSADFLSKFESKDSLEIKLTANITEVCSKKGCWMKLDMDNGKTMRVTFKDYGFFVPKDAAGRTAIIQGVAKMDTVDIATLKHYAEDADASQEEIDAITEPEINYAFEAVGVIIKENKSTSI